MYWYCVGCLQSSSFTELIRIRCLAALPLIFLYWQLIGKKCRKKRTVLDSWATLWYSASARLKLIKRSTPLLRWRHRRLLSSPTANTSTRFPKGPKMAKGFREMVPYSYYLVLCWLFWCCSFFFWGSPKILMILRLEPLLAFDSLTAKDS